jgi:phenylacetate-CoA ligase
MPASTLWSPVEALGREDLRQRQGDLLHEQVRFVAECSPLYRQRFREAGIKPSDIQSTADIGKIPMTYKSDLRAFREQHGDVWGGTLCVPTKDVVMAHHSTGTSGRPTVYGVTRRDIDAVGEIYARTLHACGFRPRDRYVVIGGMHWHGAMLGFEAGLERIGVTFFRLMATTADLVKNIFEMIPDSDLDIIPTYLPELELAYLKETGTRPREVFPNLRLVFSGQDLTAARRTMIESAWGLPLANVYASGEQYYSGAPVAGQTGFYHLPEDHFVVEVVDPETGQQVPPGGRGELVLTNLWAEGCPYLRYNLEDVVTYEIDTAPSGRTHIRIKLLGRYAWSVNVGGTHVFHGEVEEVLWDLPTTAGVSYQLVRRQQQPQDRLQLRLATKTLGDSEREQVASTLEGRLGLPVDVETVDPDALPAGPVKMQRVVTE